MSAPSPVLSIRHVSKRFDDLIAVNEADLDIREGEFITLLGPSGCGKTTLLRMIAGFETPTGGSIYLDGQDITSVPPERRPFNMVFQSYALFPHMSVFDNVAYGLRTARIPEAEVRARVEAGLHMVGLGERATVSVAALSGGQQQRVALVRALVNEPRVLLLDEPLGALDLQLRKRMQEELRAIQTRVNTTFIYVTHDQEEALVMSHRVVLMRAGEMVQVGTPHDVYHRPATRFVAEFVGETNMIPCKVVVSSNAGVEVELGWTARLHSFAHFGADELSPGEPGLVSVRPEHLALVPVGAGIFRGTLVNTILHGATSIHEIDVEGGHRLRAVARSGDDMGPGSAVGVSVGEGAGVVVRVEESAVEPTI